MKACVLANPGWDISRKMAVWRVSQKFVITGFVDSFSTVAVNSINCEAFSAMLQKLNVLCNYTILPPCMFSSFKH